MGRLHRHLRRALRSRRARVLGLLLALQCLLALISVAWPFRVAWHVAGTASDGARYAGSRQFSLDNGRVVFTLDGFGRDDIDADLTRWSFRPITNTSVRTFDAPPTVRMSGIDWRWRVWKDNRGIVFQRSSVIVVPPWLPIVLTLLTAYLLQWRDWRAQRRSRAGLCPACGYDVRATPDRCPECGFSVRAT